MKENGQRQFLWKLVAILMAVLVMIGGYLHREAVGDLDNQANDIKALEMKSALLQMSSEGIIEKQEAFSETLTEVRDAVIRIEAKIE